MSLDDYGCGSQMVVSLESQSHEERSNMGRWEQVTKQAQYEHCQWRGYLNRPNLGKSKSLAPFPRHNSPHLTNCKLFWHLPFHEQLFHQKILTTLLQEKPEKTQCVGSRCTSRPGASANGFKSSSPALQTRGLANALNLALGTPCTLLRNTRATSVLCTSFSGAMTETTPAWWSGRDAASGLGAGPAGTTLDSRWDVS